MSKADMATVKPVVAYDIKVGDTVLKDMRVESTWSGMARFVGPAGTLILEVGEVSEFQKIFGDLFDFVAPAPTKTFAVVKASPDILAAIANEKRNEKK